MQIVLHLTKLEQSHAAQLRTVVDIRQSGCRQASFMISHVTVGMCARYEISDELLSGPPKLSLAGRCLSGESQISTGADVC